MDEFDNESDFDVEVNDSGSDDVSENLDADLGGDLASDEGVDLGENELNDDFNPDADDQAEISGESEETTKDDIDEGDDLNDSEIEDDEIIETDEPKNENEQTVDEGVEGEDEQKPDVEDTNEQADVINPYLNCPRENGQWEGGEENRGETKWMPERDYIPPDNGKGNNPEGKSMGEIMDSYGIDGVRYENGEPDFSEVRYGEPVEIDDFTDNRRSNFIQADRAYSERHNMEDQNEPMTPDDVRNYRDENGLTWHEQRNCATMELVPREIHGNFSHRGGVSEYRGRK